MLGSLRKHAGDGAVQVSGGVEGLAAAGIGNEPGHVAGAVHLSPEAQDAFEVFLAVGVHYFFRREPGFLVHAHVQRSFLEAEAESALGGVELMARYAQVGQDTVEHDALVAGIVLDEAEVVVDKGEPGILRSPGYGIDVTIEGDDAAAVG